MERRLLIRTDPAGGDLRVGGIPAGTAPAVVPFSHYGTMRVEATLAGHYPATMAVAVPAPWFQWFPMDFFADNLVPWTVVDEHPVLVVLRARPQPESEEEIARARAEAERVRAAAEAARSRGTVIDDPEAPR